MDALRYGERNFPVLSNYSGALAKLVKGYLKPAGSVRLTETTRDAYYVHMRLVRELRTEELNETIHVSHGYTARLAGWGRTRGSEEDKRYVVIKITSDEPSLNTLEDFCKSLVAVLSS